VLQVGGVAVGEDVAVSGGAAGEVGQDAVGVGEVADAPGLHAVFQVGAGADDGDLEVVGPAAGGELEDQGGDDRAGAVGVTGHTQGGGFFEVEEDVAVFEVVADGDEAWVGGGDVLGLLGADEVGVVEVVGQHPYGGVAGPGPRNRQLGGLGEVELELLLGQACCPHVGQRLVGELAGVGEAAQGKVDGGDVQG